MTFEQLQAAITDERIKLSIHDNVFYATVVEENGDEFEFSQSSDINELHKELRDAGYVAE